ncbi:MAG: hypothetical protein ACO3RK_06730 [Luteolibacter sp.]|jgi:hypothetical protein
MGKVFRIKLLLLISAVAHAEPCWVHAPNSGAKAVDQLLVGANACGPAALMNSFHAGSEKWQRVFNAMGGNNDKERMHWIIRELGMRSSNHMHASPRWNKRGIGVEDLRDMANDALSKAYLPKLQKEILFRDDDESPEKLLAQAHKLMRKSLSSGFPPILSLRRYAWRKEQGKNPQWTVIEGHFVTLTRTPCKLSRDDHGFAVAYIDPWRGRHCEGWISIPKNDFMQDSAGVSSCLEATFPDAVIGKSRIRRGERTAIAVAAVIGKW